MESKANQIAIIKQLVGDLLIYGSIKPYQVYRLKLSSNAIIDFIAKSDFMKSLLCTSDCNRVLMAVVEALNRLKNSPVIKVQPYNPA